MLRQVRGASDCAAAAAGLDGAVAGLDGLARFCGRSGWCTGTSAVSLIAIMTIQVSWDANRVWFADFHSAAVHSRDINLHLAKATLVHTDP